MKGKSTILLKCAYCGKEFERPLPLYKYRRKKGITNRIACSSYCVGKLTKHDWADLEELYLIRGLSLNQIAQLKDCANTAVLYQLRQKGIPRRGMGAPGEKNYFWKGGRVRHHDGYIFIWVNNHPYSHDGYVFEHRLVMEQKLGRYLLPTEVVHHLNGIRDDNREENLIVVFRRGHARRELGALYKRRIKKLEDKVQLLEKALRQKQLIWLGGF